MERLMFLGRGCAFNPKEGNTSAYHIENNHLILLDCGESIFERIIKNNILENIKEVDIFITHLHSDHVGSLSSLIYYLYYVKKIIPTVTFPIRNQIVEFLVTQGSIEGVHYKLNTEAKMINEIEVKPSLTTHYELYKDIQSGEVVLNPNEHISPVIDVFKSYGYYLTSPNKTIYYSGDSNEFNVNLSKVDIVYQDCSIVDVEPFPHLTFKKLCNAVKKEDRHKVHLMHIDSDDIFKLAYDNGFKVVNLADSPSIYILKTISLKKKTEEDLIKEWKIRNIKYSNKEVSYEDYLEYLESWNEKEYDFSEEDNCYFTDLATAKEYAVSNMADMNDGGVYDYALIVKTDLNRAYAMTNYEEPYFFKFNYDTHKYEEVDLNDSEKGKMILKKLCIVN